MKKLTQKKEKEIKALEEEGDNCLLKETFDGCMTAVSAFTEAREKLYDAAHDESIDDGVQHPHFKSDSVAYRAWYMSLIDKASKAMSMAVRK